ncbi:hypothetical protein LRX75_21460 [Rhizobium sp. DKSPLA3]|uniref:Ribbon-helix-helix protein, CopG family n=1 Tax=Rhizobium quercicola TaxID=2901226 RepID=A0A9X1NV00_9HYPH|nr:YlcI/YnfO family protein [Rhizobium quercicola]MCD7111607.1 hypothetical protein [Rhizobium quercicola]
MVRAASIGIRLAPEVREALEEAAKADRRSMSAYVEYLIIRDLEDKGFLPKGAAE